MIKIQGKYIPSLFTIMNIFFGFLAILQIYKGEFVNAVMLVMLASVFDYLDGKIARLMNQTSQFGIEIDSLADIVSFCIVPALLINELYLSDKGVPGAIISFFPLMFGAIRLARFNTLATAEKKPYFTGLPVPANAIILGSFVWFQKTVNGDFGDSKLLLPMVIVLSFLMVSNIKFSGPPKITFKDNWISTLKSIFMLIALPLIIIWRGYILFPIFSIYIITHILMWMVHNEETRLRPHLRRKEL